MTKVNKLLLNTFLLLAIIFLLVGGFIMVRSEIIPRWQHTKKETRLQLTRVGITDIKLYVNKHYKPGADKVLGQYSFRLVNAADSIVYATSDAEDSASKPPKQFNTANFPGIPAGKMNDTFYIAYCKNDMELSRFPVFRFTDLESKVRVAYGGRSTEVQQTSTDGAMMIYITAGFDYEDQIIMEHAKP